MNEFMIKKEGKNVSVFCHMEKNFIRVLSISLECTNGQEELVIDSARNFFGDFETSKRMIEAFNEAFQLAETLK